MLPASSPSPSPIIEPDVRISRIRLSDWQLAKAAGTTRRLTGLRQVTHCRLLQQAHRKSWSFPPPAFPGFRYCDPVRLPCGPTPNSAVEAATVVQHGPPSLTPLSRRAVPNTPVDRPRCICRLLPQIVLPSPNSGRVGVHNLPFEPCSGFTRVTAGRFAPPPMATFIAELRYLPAARPTACQLSDRPTVARVGLAPTRCSRPSGTTHQTARNWRAHGTLERDDYVGEETFVLANGSRVQLSTLPTPVNHNWRTHGNRCKMRHQQQRGIIDPVGTELSQKCHVVVHQQRSQYTRARMI